MSLVVPLSIANEDTKGYSLVDVHGDLLIMIVVDLDKPLFASRFITWLSIQQSVEARSPALTVDRRYMIVDCRYFDKCI